MFPGDSTRAAGRNNTVAGAGPEARGASDWDQPGSADIDLLIEAFLDGQPDAIRTAADWARKVAAHEAWGFESPEDIVQATLLALVQNLRARRFREGDLRAYVRRIAKNMCITNYRKFSARGDHISLDHSPGLTVVRSTGDDVERRAMLNQILERMGESCRQIVVLAYVEGYSRREIGERLGISEEAARVKLFRCIQKARAISDRSEDIDMENA